MGLGVFISDKRRDIFEWFVPLTAVAVFLVYAESDKLKRMRIPAGENIYSGISRYKTGLHDTHLFSL